MWPLIISYNFRMYKLNTKARRNKGAAYYSQLEGHKDCATASFVTFHVRVAKNFVLSCLCVQLTTTETWIAWSLSETLRLCVQKLACESWMILFYDYPQSYHQRNESVKTLLFFCFKLWNTSFKSWNTYFKLWNTCFKLWNRKIVVQLRIIIKKMPNNY